MILTLHHFHPTAATNLSAAVLLQPPLLAGTAFALMPHLPVKRLTPTGAVIHLSTNRTPPKLVRPRLGPPAAAVRAQPQLLAQTSPAKPKPLPQEPVRRMDLRNRNGAPEVAQERAAKRRRCSGRVEPVELWLPRHRPEPRHELARVCLDEEAPPFGDVLPDAVAVLEAVAELAEGVHVAEEGGACAQRDAGA